MPSAIQVSRLTASTDDPTSVDYFPDYPDDAATAAEVEELVELASLRDVPDAVMNREPGRERQAISRFINSESQAGGRGYVLEGAPLLRRLFDRPSLGSDSRGLPNVRKSNVVVLTGRELANYFHGKSAASAHRQALHDLLLDGSFSASFTEWLAATLDVAIYSAVLAAWHYKWVASSGREDFSHDGRKRTRVSLRPRPREADHRISGLFSPRVDQELDGTSQSGGDGLAGSRKPSYPSRHSTYGGAASELLSYFFPDHREELERLADNAGMAQLWAGVHYRSDHVNGVRLGRTVARLLIEDIEAASTANPR